MSVNPTTNIYTGTRGDVFKAMITNLLKRAKISSKYLDILTDEESMKQYSIAYTAQSANETENQEVFEQLGDVTANKFIIWYAYRRFPQLYCPLGLKVAARLRINYGARQSFSKIADKLGFWPYISASVEARSTIKKDLLEDSVEAFCGVTEYILDSRTRQGVGNAIVYDILKSIFDDIPISLAYNDLFDAKTRLKELFDAYSDLGKWEWKDVREEKGGFGGSVMRVNVSNIFHYPNSGNGRVSRVFLGRGEAPRKQDSQQLAAQSALNLLNSKGWVKPIPKEYAAFCSFEN
jgi:dsRNA-specific ribonuclease